MFVFTFYSWVYQFVANTWSATSSGWCGFIWIIVLVTLQTGKTGWAPDSARRFSAPSQWTVHLKKGTAWCQTACVGPTGGLIQFSLPPHSRSFWYWAIHLQRPIKLIFKVEKGHDWCLQQESMLIIKIEKKVVINIIYYYTYYSVLFQAHGHDYLDL